MSLQKQIKTDIIVAMKAKQTDKLNLLRVLSGELTTNESRPDSKEKMTDEQIVRKMSNNAKEFGTEFEVEILEAYLPKMHSEVAIVIAVEKIIKDNGFSGMRNMGDVMKLVKTLPTASLFDGKLTSQIVKRLLG